MTIALTTPASISTAKGVHTGTVGSCIRWQAEYQGAWAALDVAGVSLNVDDVEFGGDELDADAPARADEATLEAICALYAVEIEGAG